MTDIINTIKTTGYWKVVIRPVSFEKDLIESLSDCKDIVRKSTVRIRGWNFPFHERSEIRNTEDHIESDTNWNQYKEYWRFYQSGQFIHLSAFKEDYLVNDIERNSTVAFIDPKNKTSKYFSVFSNLYRLTEIFEFSSRLIELGVYTAKLNISFELKDINNRMLFLWDSSRDLWRNYVAGIDSLHYSKEYDIKEIMKDKYEIALHCASYIFERFNWDSPPLELLREEQKKLVEKRL